MAPRGGSGEGTWPPTRAVGRHFEVSPRPSPDHRLASRRLVLAGDVVVVAVKVAVNLVIEVRFVGALAGGALADPLPFGHVTVRDAMPVVTVEFGTTAIGGQTAGAVS